MMGLIDLLSWICFVAGGGLCITGAVGLLRFPDLFSRMHGAGVAETLGAPLMLLGLMLQIGWSLDAAKVLLIIGLILATGPTTTHALAQAALKGGLKPIGQQHQEPLQDQDGSGDQS